MDRPLLNPKRPCGECPWRTDVPPDHFPPERFEALAKTAYDMSPVLFQCHETRDEVPLVCAGFLLRGAQHNLSVRLAQNRGALIGVEDGGLPLFRNYRAMAIANGVDPDAEELKPCR